MATAKTSKKTADKPKARTKSPAKKPTKAPVSDSQPDPAPVEESVPEEAEEAAGVEPGVVPPGFGSAEDVPRLAQRQYDPGVSDSGGNPVHSPDLTAGLDRPDHRSYDSEGRPQG